MRRTQRTTLMYWPSKQTSKQGKKIIGTGLQHNTSLTWTYRENFQRLCLHCQPMTDWRCSEILVKADLLPSTGFKMNFLVKCSAGGISKFAIQSLFFVIRILSQSVNPSSREPVNVPRLVILSWNRHSSAIYLNIFIRFEVIVNETLFSPLVYYHVFACFE